MSVQMSDRRYMVTQDGQPIKRDLTLKEATQVASVRASKYEGHTASDKQRVPEFEVKVDTQFMRDMDDNYKQWKADTGKVLVTRS